VPSPTSPVPRRADARGPEPTGPSWGAADVVAGLAIGIVASTVAVAVALGVGDFDSLDDAPMWVFALLQLPLWLGLAGVPVYAARVKGRGLVEDFGARMRPRDVPIGLAIGVVAQLVVVPLVSWPLLWLLDEDAEELERRAREVTDRAEGAGIVLLVLVLVVGAPLVEELFYRGLTLRVIARRFGPVAAVAGSSVLFAVTHFHLLGLPALVAFGVIAGILVVRSGRLGPAVWAHAGFNLTTVILLLADR
jgi:uncharacterized protein